MRASKIVLISVLVAAAGGVAYLVTRKEPPKPTEVVTADVQKGTVQEKVRAVGHVEPVTQVNVSASVSGDLLALHVKEGQTVARGALLAQIDSERLLAIVRQQEANQRSAAASVGLEVTQGQQALLEKNRTEELFKQTLVTQAELEKARAEVEIIAAREEAARQRVAQAQATLDEAKDQLSKTRLFAPIDGTVIALNKKVGERIRGSELSEDILLTLAPLHAMQVEVEVSEQDVVKTAEGQTAEIVFDALRGQTWPGRVVEIANSAVIQNKGTELETTSFKVKVALEKVPERLRPGMSAQVGIVTKTRQDVVMVPIEAVTARLPSELEKRAEAVEEGNKGVLFRDPQVGKEDKDPVAKRERPVELVFKVVDGKVEPAKVKTGISSDLEVEILEGIEVGAEVVVGPYAALARTLKPGSPIKVLRKLNPVGSATTSVARGD